MDFCQINLLECFENSDRSEWIGAGNYGEPEVNKPRLSSTTELKFQSAMEYDQVALPSQAQIRTGDLRQGN